ncbi:nop2/Sun-like domain containing protein 5 isoform X2 [Megachile rotundata]|nr:PREDICTED: probable 28S rRNA (cytosine-C(5))-methyltransferase isoform X2 [Megachile rotundata]
MTAIRKSEQLNTILSKTGLLTNEPRLDPWLAKVLITELLWGKKALKTECKPAQIILSYETKLKEELSAIKTTDEHETPDSVHKARYVRINTIKLPLEKGISYFKEEGWVLLPKCSDYTKHLEVVKNLEKPNFIQDFHIPELFVFPKGTNFQDDRRYEAGEILIQDKASCLAAKILDPKPGSVVLDMCAAPGMKTSHLAALMNNTGTIYAVEFDVSRYAFLCKQVKATGATCVKTIQKDALKLDGNNFKDVEYILVDPSCSGSGMLDRQITDEKEKPDPQRLRQLQSFQVFLLRRALLHFPNVKKVVYSTCSINPEENEQVVDEILTNVKDSYKLVDTKDLYKENWLHFSSRDFTCSDKCLYTKPDVDLCNGFFIAVFERNVGTRLPKQKRKLMVRSNSKKARMNAQPYVKEAAATQLNKKPVKRNINAKPTPAQKSSPKVPKALNDSTDSVAIIEEMSSEVEVEEIKQQPPAKKKKVVGRSIRKAIKAKTPLARKMGKKRIVKLPKRVKKTV